MLLKWVFFFVGERWHENAHGFTSCLCVPLLLWEGAVLTRMAQDEISISVIAMAGRKYMNVGTSTLQVVSGEDFYQMFILP